MKLIFLLPALAYLVLVLINLPAFSQTQNINFFWLYNADVPLGIMVSIFFIVYIVFIWVWLNLWSYFTGYKNRKLEKQVLDLKSKLLDKQWDIIKSIEKHNDEVLAKFKSDEDQKIDLYKKENEKVVTNMQYDFDLIKKELEAIKKIKSK